MVHSLYNTLVTWAWDACVVTSCHLTPQRKGYITLDNYMYICSINLVEHWFFEPPWEKQIGSNYREVQKIEGKHTVFDCWRKVKFGSNYQKPRVQERGGEVCTEATNSKSIGLILTFPSTYHQKNHFGESNSGMFFIVILSLCRVL